MKRMKAFVFCVFLNILIFSSSRNGRFHVLVLYYFYDI